MSAGKFIAGFIVGGIVGAVTGVLLAPQSGEETREKIKESSQKAYDKAHGAVKEIQEKAETISNDMAKKGEELINKIQGMIDKQKNQEAQQEG
ncbi:YtxH domain-containing protein [bacterium]|nr:YtxH domain-containing protein [bacterium]MBQ9149434.1 YtxH domain-containing protein [bacterium]